MTYQIIKTENYLLVLSDDEIKEGNLIYEADTDTINTAGKDYHNFTEADAKIIAHLPLNGAPVLEGVDLLPPIEDDEAICPYPEEKQNAVDWHNGYNKAREKYKYTEEDLKKAYIFGRNNGELKSELNYNDLLYSLDQYPTAFECEMEEGLINQQTKINDWGLRPKTTTINGRIVLVGKYIY